MLQTERPGWGEVKILRLFLLDVSSNVPTVHCTTTLVSTKTMDMHMGTGAMSNEVARPVSLRPYCRNRRGCFALPCQGVSLEGFRAGEGYRPEQVVFVAAPNAFQ